MLKLSEVAPHQWEFAYPEIYYLLMDEFHSGCDAFEEGNLFAAERIFKSVLEQMPDHLDAIHHLAMVRTEQGQVLLRSEVQMKLIIIGSSGDHSGRLTLKHSIG